MSSALKRLLKERPTKKDVLKAQESLLNDSPRASAVVACALLEDVLRAALVNVMDLPSKEDHDRLFYNYGPLSSLSAKTLMAACLNVIGPNVRSDIDTIRAIRNAFAHNLHDISFLTNEIAELCASLKCIQSMSDKGELSSQEHFVAAVRVIMIHLISRWMPENERADIPADILELG
jgi:DNA-binding MltR family transcriptional regulator